MAYQNMDILLATKHQKEQAIREPFEKAFQAKIIVPKDFDTDKFGTFTGEIPRTQSAQETVIQKAIIAAKTYGIERAIASEGSFGPHPMHFLSACDIELISFVDVKSDIIVVESDISTQTNFAHCDISPTDDYSDFLKRSLFGTHGLIIRSLEDHSILAKGITELHSLEDLLKKAFRLHQTLRLETDMRAMMNPTRMKVIHQVAKKLITRLQQHCHRCQTPGFGKPSVQGSLHCQACGQPTHLYQHKVMSCIKCDYAEYHPRTDGLTLADPMYCNHCNP